MQYLGSDDILSKPKENLVTLMFEENLFRKYKNNIEVFVGINETNDNLKIKHVIPQISKMLLDPGSYTFFIISKTKYVFSENSGGKFSKPYIYRVLFTGEPGKVYLFSQPNNGKDETFEFQSVTD